jgi:protein O-GlcNAc transferase
MTPQSTQSIFDQAVKLHASGEFEEAEKLYIKVLEQDPNRADAMHWLGVLESQTGWNPEAVVWIEKSIAIDSGVADAHYNLAMVLSKMGQYAKAIPAFEKAIQLRPDHVDALCGLATALRRTENYDDAIAMAAKALQYEPNLVKAHNNLASYYRAIGKLDDALTSYGKALAIKPQNHTVASNRLFLLPYHPKFDSQSILREARIWDQKFAQPLAKQIQPHPNSKDPTRPLRIGFVSSDFRNHCQTFFTLPLLANLDYRQFEVFCYSDVKDPDEYTTWFENQSSAIWRQTASLSDHHLAEGIRSDRIDILFDLTMHMAGGRPLLFARKPAPAQVAYLAYPGTTGISTMDYRLTDPWLDDGTDADYSERSIRLADTFWCYDPLGDYPVAQSLPASQNSHITFGCLNNFCKINPATLRLWGKVMRQVPNSRLIMLAPPGSHRQEIPALLGIDPSRIDLLPTQPRDDYLRTYDLIDLTLDTLPYNGHTTSLDALWMGVPVVTLVGKTVVGRAGWSQLNNLNLIELAAFNESDFVRIATQLAADLPRLAELRATLRGQMQQSPLMDAPRFARNFEQALRSIWREFCLTP